MYKFSLRIHSVSNCNLAASFLHPHPARPDQYFQHFKFLNYGKLVIFFRNIKIVRYSVRGVVVSAAEVERPPLASSKMHQIAYFVVLLFLAQN